MILYVITTVKISLNQEKDKRCPLFVGQTHDNKCEFSYKQCISEKRHNHGLKIVKNGPCDNHNNNIPDKVLLPSCDFFCDESEEPLCDNMGHTHKNLCKFDLAKCRRINRGLNVPEIVHIGECKKDELREFRRQRMFSLYLDMVNSRAHYRRTKNTCCSTNDI